MMTFQQITEAIVRSVQLRLSVLGYYTGKLDGVVGPKTQHAITDFKRTNGLRARPAPLDITLPLMFSEEAEPTGSNDEDTPPLLKVMRALVGLRETPGAGNNQTIVDYAHDAGIDWYASDATPWCAVIVNGALVEAGYPSTKSALARSFMDYGEPVDLLEADIGDIVVFPRGSEPWQGHVEVIDEVIDDDFFIAIGGNVTDRVKRSKRSFDDVLPNGIRRPVRT